MATPQHLPDAGNQTWIEGQLIKPTLSRISTTSATISWNIPVPIGTYNGALILLSRTEINPSNYPSDGQLYVSSADWSVPQDSIGSARVVGAFYNDTTTNTVTITNLVPTDVYFATVHLITNVRTYYTIGSPTYSPDQNTSAYAASIGQYYAPPTDPTLGQLYYDATQKLLFRWIGDSWSKVGDQTIKTGATNPAVADFVGDIFYNTSLGQLLTWNGAIWVNGEEGGRVPMYNRANVGTDLTSDERADLIDVLKAQLGYPVVCVELTNYHFNIAINNALQEIRHRVDNAYYRQYVAMTLKAGQQVYYLNNPEAGTDKIVDIIKIHRLNVFGINQGQNTIYAQSYFTQLLNPGSAIDLVSVHLFAQLGETFNLLFAGDIPFNWRETTRQLTTYRRVHADERILVECSFEKTEQELLSDRNLVQWIQQWAESEAMFMLAKMRGKYASLPGPGGGLSLNGSELAAEAERLQTDCLRQINEMEIGNGGAEFGNHAFLIG